MSRFSTIKTFAALISLAGLTTINHAVAAETPIAYSGIPDAAKVILAGAMILGRLETLAIIALFNPEIWQR